jgi:hypothetical protein
MKNNKKSPKAVHEQITSQTLTLASTSLGLVAALAWNEAIKELVDVYIKPFFPEGSGLLTLFVYAIFITTITVIVSLQLTKVNKKLLTKD